jgi:hypothetical protein
MLDGKGDAGRRFRARQDRQRQGLGSYVPLPRSNAAAGPRSTTDVGSVRGDAAAGNRRESGVVSTAKIR